jgi:hypothetical protein
MQSREQRELVCSDTEYPGDVGFLYFCSIGRFERDSLTLVLFSSTFCLFGFVVCAWPYSDCWREIFDGFLVQRGADVCGFL